MSWPAWTTAGLRKGYVHLGPFTIYLTGEAHGRALAEVFRTGVQCGRLPEPPPRTRQHLRAVS